MTTRSSLSKYNSPEYQQFLARMRRIGARLNPATAEVFFLYTDVLDPYCVVDQEGENYGCIGRVFFAVDPDGDDPAVSFYELPAKTVEALGKKRDAADREGWRALREGQFEGVPDRDGSH